MCKKKVEIFCGDRLEKDSKPEVSAAMRNKEIKIFCTGGLDSTFMLCKLSRRKIVLQPIYVLNPKRKSRKYELKAVRKIISKLLKHPDTKAEIKKLKIVNLNKIVIDERIRLARHRLVKKFGMIGWQYDYLASLTAKIGMVGLGIESNPIDGENVMLRDAVKLKKTRYGYVFDKDKSSEDATIVFGNFLYPILDDTEQDMLKWAKRYKYSHILKLIWFCHNPIHGKPCGLCSPCEGKMQSGMEILLPVEARKRYYQAKKMDFLSVRISRLFKNTIYRVILTKREKRQKRLAYRLR